MQAAKSVAIFALLVTAYSALGQATGSVAKQPDFSGSAPDNEVIVLQRFVVTATRIDGRPWRYGSIPGFEILSRCDDSQTKDYIRAIEVGNAIDKLLLPEASLTPISTPTTVILYNGGDDSGSSKPLLPNQVGIVHDDGFFWGAPVTSISKPRAIEDVDSLIDCISLPPINPLNLPGSDDGVSPFVHKTLRFRLQHRTPEYPRWVIEGLFGPSGVYRNGVLSSTEGDRHSYLKIPTALWLSQQDTALLREGAKISFSDRSNGINSFIPIAQLLAAGSPKQLKDLPSWSSEAALFVRWGMYGHADNEPVRQSTFWKFVDASISHPVTDDLLKRYLGLGSEELEFHLRQYLTTAVRDALLIPANLDQNPPVPELSDATEAEIARIIGNWERVKAGSLKEENASLSGRYRQEAGKTLLDAYSKGSRDPDLLGVLGLYEYSIDDRGKAREFLEEAVERKVVRPSVYLTLARLRFLENKDAPDGKNGKFSPKQVADVLKPLFGARQQSPAMADTYRLIADTWANSEVKPSPGNLAVLDEGAALFWADRALADSTSKLRLQWGYDEKR